MNNLTFISSESKIVNSKSVLFWTMKCYCGTIFTARNNHIKSGFTSSCGCKRASTEISGMKHIYSIYKSAAKKRKYDFKLTFEEFKSFIIRDCFICRKSPRNKKISNVTIKVNGIDRVDNKKGYVLENCITCCSDCNRMKSDLHIGKFLLHINNIYNQMRPIIEIYKRNIK